MVSFIEILKYRNCSKLSSAYGHFDIYVSSVQIKSKHLEDHKPKDIKGLIENE
jgi:hypothetical protein